MKPTPRDLHLELAGLNQEAAFTRTSANQAPPASSPPLLHEACI